MKFLSISSLIGGGYRALIEMPDGALAFLDLTQEQGDHLFTSLGLLGAREVLSAAA